MTARLAARFSNNPFRRAASLSICDAVRRICDPHRVTSYGDAGADILLNVLGGHHPSKYYVDVGCSHPISGSNTYLLYQKGWVGLCIDANPDLIDIFKSVRPRDDAVCACIGLGGEAEFAICAAADYSHVVGQGVGRAGSLVQSTKIVTLQPLGEIFAKHNVPRSFGILSVDVEGSTFDALRSFDIEQYRPSVILIEIGNFLYAAAAEHPVVQYLQAHSYSMNSFSGWNGFFVNQR